MRGFSYCSLWCGVVNKRLSDNRRCSLVRNLRSLYQSWRFVLQPDSCWSLTFHYIIIEWSCHTCFVAFMKWELLLTDWLSWCLVISLNDRMTHCQMYLWRKNIPINILVLYTTVDIDSFNLCSYRMYLKSWKLKLQFKTNRHLTFWICQFLHVDCFY